MNKEIVDIIQFQIGKNKFEYRGTLRNEYKFRMDEDIFFTPSKYEGRKLARGVIVGIEKTVSDNPEFIYKIRLHPNVLEQDPNLELEFANIKCDSIFKSIDDAKKSALKALSNAFELSKEAIDLFFKEYGL